MAVAGFWEGWIGWGIGVRMIGASAIVLVPDGGGFFVSRYHLTSYREADIVPDTGDLVLANNSIKVGRFSGALKRANNSIKVGHPLWVAVPGHRGCAVLLV